MTKAGSPGLAGVATVESSPWVWWALAGSCEGVSWLLCAWLCSEELPDSAAWMDVSRKDVRMAVFEAGDGGGGGSAYVGKSLSLLAAW